MNTLDTLTADYLRRACHFRRKLARWLGTPKWQPIVEAATR